jgi:hypothetical protein
MKSRSARIAGCTISGRESPNDRADDAAAAAQDRRHDDPPHVAVDPGRLSKLANETLDADIVVADRGYFDGEEIKACVEAGITVTLPKPQTSGSKAKGRFVKQDFVQNVRTRFVD